MILKTRSGEVEHRVFAGAAMPTRPAFSSAGVTVTAESVYGVPAVTAAVRFAAQEVASLNVEVWRGSGVLARRTESPWQARFLSGPPNPEQTLFDFWATVEESLSYRGNAYVWKVQDGSRLGSWWALHPDQVQPQWGRDGGGVEYWVTTGGGYMDPIGDGWRSYRLRGEILHIRGFGDGGALFAPSPIERHRDTLGAAVAKPRYESAFYEHDATGGMVVTFPESVTVEQARDWRDLIAGTYEGPANAGRTKIFGGGAAVSTIGLSQRDAQFVESVGMTVQEVARIFGVPASLIDGERGSEPLTPEHEMTRWLRFGLLPRVKRIEAALAADADLFGTGARIRPRFNTDEVVRGDLGTQETIDHQRIQDGRLLVDEWRADHGLDPLPGGAGMVPQVTPVGGGPNPQAAASAPAVEDDSRGRGRVMERETVREYSAIHLNPQFTVTQEARDIVIPAAAVTVQNVVEPTPVTVEVEAHAHVDATVEAPNVQVDAPVLIEAPRRHIDIERDPSGRITGATVEDTN